MLPSTRFSLNWRDAGKAILLAFLTAFFSTLALSLNAEALPTLSQLKLAGIAGVIAAISYITKNFFTNDVPTAQKILDEADKKQIEKMQGPKTLLVIGIMLSLTATMHSCSPTGKFQFTTTYSQEAVNQLNTVSQKIGAIYTAIQTSTDRSFSTYQNQYDSAIALLTELKKLEDTRVKNKAIIYQSTNALEMFTKYMNEHKAKGSITIGEATVYQLYMKSFFDSWKLAERSLNK